MAFVESPRFPYKISFGATGGPVFSTEVVRTSNGTEYRYQWWEQALRRFDVSHAARNQELFNSLLDYYHAMSGRMHGFRFRDWSDYTATGTQGEFAMLTGTTFQMYKAYVTGSNTHHRKIQKPFNEGSGVIVTGGVTPVVDYTTGIVTVASGSPTSWTGVFDVPCRFDADDMRAEIIDGRIDNRVFGWQSITLSEFRL